MSVLLLVDGPFGGEEIPDEDVGEEVRIRTTDDRLPSMLKASVEVKQRGMAVVPSRVAVYRKVKQAGGKVVPIRPHYVLRFVGWEES